MSEVRYKKLPGSSSDTEIIGCNKMDEGWSKEIKTKWELKTSMVHESYSVI